MRAFALTDFDAAPTIVDLPVPEPAEGEVRVRIAAASVNGFDLSVAGGHLKDMMEHRLPVVLGKDFAGTVDAVGPGVTDYRVGDAVFGVVTKAYLGDGSFAEKVVVPTEIGLAHLPEGIEPAEGAALGLAGTTAVQAIEAAAVRAGESVLVIGATGGVGTRAVQLAAAAGASVIATAGTDQARELLTALGAAYTVDPAGDVVAQVRELHPEGVDVLIHLAGDPAPAVEAVSEAGRIASTMIMSPDQLPAPGRTVHAVYATPDTASLDRVARAHADSTARVVVQDTYTLDQVPAAFEAFVAGTLGKLVITVDGTSA